MVEMIQAVLWDFGGVVTTSPFEAFARYEREQGLPEGFIRRLNTVNPQDNAWARLERSELGVDAFCEAFEAEARAAGGELSGHAVLDCLSGQPRPEMVRALRQVGTRFRTACLTNNVRHDTRSPDEAAEIRRIMAMFDVVIESREVGVRKPEPEFYRIALERVGVAPEAAVFLDDLGVNLKPAREMGMHTIKVGTPDQALAELGALLGMRLG